LSAAPIARSSGYTGDGLYPRRIQCHNVLSASSSRTPFDTAAILAEIQKAGFKIVSLKKMFLSLAQAEGFYYVHAARPFFGELTEFMSSGPIYPMVLEKENAIADLRILMGATDPAKAADGTIRKLFASSIGENAIHGSDAEETAAFEIGYFFAGCELK
jgi:nucleoside-diphosphate kinase